MVSRVKGLLAVAEMLPAASVWVAVTVLAPSGPTTVAVKLKALEVHAVVVGVTPIKVTVRPDSQLPCRVKVEFTTALAAGLVKVTTGAVLSTFRVVLLGPAAAEVLPTPSVATAAATLIVTVPVPVQPLSVRVRDARLAPDTALVQLAVPVLFKVTSELVNETLATPAPVSTKLRLMVAEPEFLTRVGDTLPKVTTGPELSRTTDTLAGVEILPARSVWVTLMALAPSPADKVTI
jgi:hypothetical protein